MLEQLCLSLFSKSVQCYLQYDETTFHITGVRVANGNGSSVAISLVNAQSQLIAKCTYNATSGTTQILFANTQPLMVKSENGELNTNCTLLISDIFVKGVIVSGNS